MQEIGLKKGYFISFEGADGVGKSTQIDLLRQGLQKCGFTVKMLREPGGCKISEKIRDIVKDPANKNMCSEAELLLMSAARAQLVREVIKPALDAGEIVICDRFYHSTIVYQGFGRRLDQQYIKATIQFSTEDTVPDVTFVLYLTPDQVEKRRKERGTDDRIEGAGKEFRTRVEAGFAWLVNHEKKFPDGKIVAINADNSIENIANEIFRCSAARISGLKQGQLVLDPSKQLVQVGAMPKGLS